MGQEKIIRRIRRKLRIRDKVKGTHARPRVSIYRSNQWLYVQFIDDDQQKTLLGLSNRNMKISSKNQVVRASEFGKLAAEKAIKQKIHTVVFDRGGYAYHGRVKALADGLRQGGLKF